MKTWEMIKMLNENPNLVFQCKNEVDKGVQIINGVLCWSPSKTPFELNIKGGIYGGTLDDYKWVVLGQKIKKEDIVLNSLSTDTINTGTLMPNKLAKPTKPYYNTDTIIRLMHENPQLKFKCIQYKKIFTAKYDFVTVNNNRICWGGDTSCPLYVLVGEEMMQWEKIEDKQVDFITAFMAWQNQDKEIYCLMPNEVEIHYFPKDKGRSIYAEEIKNGKWFIKGV